MLGSIFKEDEEENANSAVSFRPKDCASHLDLPPMVMQESGFVGLENL